MASESHVEVARRVLTAEAAAIERMAEQLGDGFEAAVERILACEGRVITCGVGTSGHIARKTSGTLASTGTPSLFLHAAEAVHGDLGMVAPGDVALLYTHSGETDEIVRLFPALRSLGARTILITGRAESSAAREADHVLATGVTSEACPNDLAPTTSTTAMLALSDALAVAVMTRRGFSREDFARLHPSGALGKRLLLRVRDVMHPLDRSAVVQPEAPFAEVLRAITDAGVGAALVLAPDGGMAGFISDGDLRRYLLAHPGSTEAAAGELMTPKVTTVDPDLLAVEALEIFQHHPKRFTQMPVLKDGKLLGLLTLRELMRSGIV